MISNIQILRAFAAIIVVVFHIAGTASSYSQDAPVFHFFGSWGASGVDIFFVISGFVMLYTQLLKRKTPCSFSAAGCCASRRFTGRLRCC